MLKGLHYKNYIRPFWLAPEWGASHFVSLLWSVDLGWVTASWGLSFLICKQRIHLCPPPPLQCDLVIICPWTGKCFVQSACKPKSRFKALCVLLQALLLPMQSSAQLALLLCSHRFLSRFQNWKKMTAGWEAPTFDTLLILQFCLDGL